MHSVTTFWLDYRMPGFIGQVAGTSIRTAFSARGIDPRLRGYDWLVDLLLERSPPPPNGYPPAPSGILDLDTAWREVLAQFLGLQEAELTRLIC